MKKFRSSVTCAVHGDDWEQHPDCSGCVTCLESQLVMVEFFCGEATMAAAYRKAGYRTFTVDMNPDLKPDLVADIMTLQLSDLPVWAQHPTVVHASVPCNRFSVAMIGKNWTLLGGVPFAKNAAAAYAVALVYKTLDLIQQMKPKYWSIENPRGMLRQFPFMQVLPRKTVTYCQYGAVCMKPTDIWTNITQWEPRKMCSNGDSCHEASPRGSTGGVQGMADARERAVIPPALAREISEATLKPSASLEAYLHG